MAPKRVYDTNRWRQLRARKLKANPLCAPCLKRGVHRPANTVDHNIAVEAGGPAFPPLSGLTSMCASCHGMKTSAQDRPDRRPGRGLNRGCNADGRPLDPAHEWNQPATTPGGNGSNLNDLRGATDATNVSVVTSRSSIG